MSLFCFLIDFVKGLNFSDDFEEGDFEEEDKGIEEKEEGEMTDWMQWD